MPVLCDSYLCVFVHTRLKHKTNGAQYIRPQLMPIVHSYPKFPFFFAMFLVAFDFLLYSFFFCFCYVFRCCWRGFFDSITTFASLFSFLCACTCSLEYHLRCKIAFYIFIAWNFSSPKRIWCAVASETFVLIPYLCVCWLKFFLVATFLYAYFKMNQKISMQFFRSYTFTYVKIVGKAIINSPGPTLRQRTNIKYM